MDLEDSRLGVVTGQSEARQTEAIRARGITNIQAANMALAYLTQYRHHHLWVYHQKARRDRYSKGDGTGGEVRVRGKEGNARHQENLHSSLYSVLLETLPKVTGVFFDKSQERWVSSVYMGGRNIKSYFPVYKHGFLQARNMAISQRLSQVAHKGISRTEMDSLTPAGLTIEALLEVLGYKGALLNESATVAATAPGQKNKSFSIPSELQAHATAEQPKSHQATPPSLACSSELQRPKLATKGSGESLMMPSVSSNSVASLSENSVISPFGLGTPSSERCGNSSTVLSVYHHELSDERCVESGPRALFSTLHSYAAFEFSPWEKGITWHPETFSWAVHSALRRECVVYVPVRLEKKYKEIIEVVGQWLAKAGDIGTPAKFAPELTHVGRSLASKTQMDEALGTELHAASPGDAPLGVKEEQQLPSEALKEREHTDEASSSSLSVPRSLSHIDVSRETELAPSRRPSAPDGGNGPETLECRRPPTIHAEGDGAARDALEKAADAVFRAVGEAYAEGLVLLHRLNEVRSDDELVAVLQSVPDKRDDGKIIAGADSSAGLALALQDLSSGEGSISTAASHESAARADELMSRAWLTFDSGALKLWPQGASLVTSSAEWLAVARLACGSRVARSSHMSSKEGDKEVYHRLACELSQRTTENMAGAALDETGAPLSSSSSSQNQPEFSFNREGELVLESADLEQQQQRRPSKGTSGLLNGEVPAQSVPKLLQHRVLLESPLPHADQPLCVTVEGVPTKHSCCGISCCSSYPGRCSSSSSRCAPSEAAGVAIARSATGGPDSASPRPGRKKTLHELESQRGDCVVEDYGELDCGLRRAQPASLAAALKKKKPVAEEADVRLLCLQWQAVRRCLLDLRELTPALFAPHVGEHKAAVVDAHLSLVSTCGDFQQVLVYVRLFESALLEGQLPSQMPVATQRVFFGALDALAEARKL
ncbi:hypothetical protein Esti_003900 [Eimeria stiedai]